MPVYKKDPRHIFRDPTNKCNGKMKNHNSTDDGEDAYCGRGAGWGTNHAGVGRCKHHGGAAPTYQATAEALAAGKAVAQYGLPQEIDPHTALLEELYRTKGHVEWLRLRVAELETDTMVGPVGGGQGGFPSYEPSVWIRMYRDERIHLVRVAKSCHDAGIEDRKVKVAEAQALLFAKALQNILEALGVGDHPDAPRIVRKELLLLESGDQGGSFGESGAVDLVSVTK